MFCSRNYLKFISSSTLILRLRNVYFLSMYDFTWKHIHYAFYANALRILRQWYIFINSYYLSVSQIQLYYFFFIMPNILKEYGYIKILLSWKIKIYCSLIWPWKLSIIFCPETYLLTDWMELRSNVFTTKCQLW